MIDHCYCKTCVQYIYPHMVSTFYVRNTQNNILKYVSCKIAAFQRMTHLKQNRVDNTSLPLAAFQRLNAQSSNLYRSVHGPQKRVVSTNQ